MRNFVVVHNASPCMTTFLDAQNLPRYGLIDLGTSTLAVANRLHIVLLKVSCETHTHTELNGLCDFSSCMVSDTSSFRCYPSKWVRTYPWSFLVVIPSPGEAKVSNLQNMVVCHKHIACGQVTMNALREEKNAPCFMIALFHSQNTYCCVSASCAEIATLHVMCLWPCWWHE